MSLLLVEDDPVDRMAIERGIGRGEGTWTLRCATTLAEAREALRDDPPDLVILDYELPDGTGLEFQGELGGLPSVFVTGGDSATLAVQAMQAGALDFIVKDIDRSYVDLLPQVIENALEAIRVREELRQHREELDRLVRERTAELEAAKLQLEREIRTRGRLYEELAASEARYRGLVEASHGLLFRLDSEGTITYLNPEWERSLGFSLEEMIGKEFVSLAHPEAVAGHGTEWGKLKEGKAIRSFETVLSGKQGQEVHVVLNAIPLRSEAGAIVGVQGSAYDMTEYQRATEARAASEERFRATFEQRAVGITHISPQGRIVRVNDRHCEITGYGRDELLRMNVQDLTHPEDRAASRARLEEALAGGMEQYSLEKRYVRKTGETVWVNLSASVVRSPAGEVSYLIGVVEDITERKRAEEALRESSARLVKAQRVAGMGFLDWNLETNEIIWSEEVYRLYGVDPQVQTATLDLTMSLLHPDDLEVAERSLERAIEGIEPHDLDHRIVRPDGETIWVNARAAIRRDEEGGPAALLGTVVDITERKRAEEEVRASERRLSSLFEHVPISLWEEDFSDVLAYLEELDFREIEDFEEYLREHPEVVAECAKRVCITAVNRATLELHEAATTEELLEGLPKTFTERSYEAFGEELVAIWRGSTQHEMEAEVRTLTGTPRQVVIGWSVAPGSEETLSRVLVSIFDLTERRRAEQELLDSRERLHILAKRLREVREDERAAIARELHDELGQGLTALKMDLSLLEDGLPAEMEGVGERVRKIMGLADQSLDLVQALSAKLRSPVLDVLGLWAAVEWQINEFSERYGVACELDLGDAEPRLGEDVKIAAFRILQEALTNVARHAEASRVRVRLEEAFGQVMLEVEDDGVGVSDEVLESYESLGLIGMRERAEALEGEVKIERRPEGGMRVTLTLPSGEPGAGKEEAG